MTLPGWTRGARCAIAAAAAVTILSGVWLGLRLALPGDGAPWRQDPGFVHGLTVDVPRSGSGLRSGDTVVAVDGLPLDKWLAGSSSRPRLSAGTVLTYRVQRGGNVLDVPVRIDGRDRIAPLMRREAGVGVAAIALLAIGWYTIRRRPDHPASHALVMLGAALLTAYAFTSAAPWEVAHLVTAPWLFDLGMFGAVPAFVVLVAALAHLTWTFPRPPDVLRRHPSVIGWGYGTALLATLGTLLAYLLAGPPTIAGLQNWYTASSWVLDVLGVLAAAGVVRLAVTALRDAQLRAQMRYVGVALGATVAGLLILNVAAANSPASPWIVGVLFLPLPLAISAALLRGQFLDVKATLNRALIYILTTTVLLGAYVGLVELLAAIANSSGIATTLPATAVIALAFAPVRARVQLAVERWLYGERGQPGRVLAALGARLEVALPPDETLTAVVDTIAATLRVPYVALSVAGDHEALACERGEPPPQPDSIELIHQGELVGHLLVAPRYGERTLTHRDRVLLTGLAPHLAATVRATALITELTESRTKLAVAREDERAILRHDLHDRIGSRLVGASLQLDAATQHAQGSAVEAQLRDACQQIDLALNEIRRLARGLRPAELDELGLVAAVQAAVARMTVDETAAVWHPHVIAAVHLPALTADVESAAYQIALEALTNSYRHSNAQQAQVRIATDPLASTLILEVTDDGIGISADTALGVGLQSMHDRASAVGGWLTIDSPPGGGALVRAELPIG